MLFSVASVLLLVDDNLVGRAGDETYIDAVQFSDDVGDFYILLIVFFHLYAFFAEELNAFLGGVLLFDESFHVVAVGDQNETEYYQDGNDTALFAQPFGTQYFAAENVAQ